jgi:hypothetical protein
MMYLTYYAVDGSHCPFCAMKEAFKVSREKNAFICHRSTVKSNSLDFVQQRKRIGRNVKDKEAAEFIAGKIKGNCRASRHVSENPTALCF